MRGWLLARLGAAEWLFLSGGVLHAVAVPEHLREWWGYGLFFAVVAAGQAAYSLLLPRLGSRRWFLVSGVVGTLVLLEVWLQSRLSHPPVGPHRLHAEEFGLLDGLSAVVEVAVLPLLVVALLHRTTSPTAQQGAPRAAVPA